MFAKKLVWALIRSFWTGKIQQRKQVREIVWAIVSQKIVFCFREAGSILRGGFQMFQRIIKRRQF